MAWVCDKCGREFRNENQWHSCYTVGIENHLEKRPVGLKRIFHALLEYCSGFEKIEIIPVKSSIQFRSGAVFLSVKLKIDRVEMEFQLPEEWNDPRVFKSQRVSSRRVFHAVTVKHISDIDDLLLSKIERSYNLINSKINSVS